MKSLLRQPITALILLIAAVIAVSGDTFSADSSALELSGYFARDGDDAGAAQMSGRSEFVRFYPGRRIVRLYIPYPYSSRVSPDTLRRAFAAAVATTTGSAYLRGRFGVLEQEAIAHLDTLRLIEGRLLFDCGKAIPCEVEFSGGEMVVVTPGLVKNKETHYHLVRDQGSGG